MEFKAHLKKKAGLLDWVEIDHRDEFG
jgi:hypothetical protein